MRFACLVAFFVSVAPAAAQIYTAEPKTPEQKKAEVDEFFRDLYGNTLRCTIITSDYKVVHLCPTREKSLEDIVRDAVRDELRR